MATELGARLKRALEVDAAADLPVGDGGLGARLVRGIDAEDAARALAAHRRHGEAAAVARHGRADLERARRIAGEDAEAPIVALDDLADVGDDAGEHAGAFPLPLVASPHTD